ncbi:translation initiation factor IF-3 [Verrucomicrobiota bacterium]
MRSFIRTNHRIKVSEVRCSGAKGEMLGVMSTKQALTLARQAGLDLVEISPKAKPPVCRIMDYGKYKYEESRKDKLAKKHQHGHALKEIKFHSNVAEHDYQTKTNHIRQFLEKGHKVKVSLMFRGREMAHRELGFEVVSRVIKDCEDLSMVDSAPRMMGRTIVAMIGPRSKK